MPAGLDENGRCSIHADRPGLCRLFPLGRNYNEKGLRYFLLEDACRKQNRTKIKIKKWLEVNALPQYEKFLIEWHDFRKQMQEKMIDSQSDAYAQNVNVKMLEIFYQKPYDTDENFYLQFEKRKRGFYKSVGFKPLITLTEMWDEENPCLIMVKSLA